MKTIATVKLRIRDQNELLNQIAGTYKDFFRAAMEYVDNAIDAAEAMRRKNKTAAPSLEIRIDTSGKKIIFTDNCGGMSPQELCELLSEVGRSKKKTVSWANGQFGFGVHAFRAFAKEAEFISKKENCLEARIKINRATDENVDVACEQTDGKQLTRPGTRVILSRFDAQVFKRAIFFRSLVSEIEHHFDDVLRAGLVRILVAENGSRPFECQYFDFEKMPGVPLKGNIDVPVDGAKQKLTYELKILEKVQDNRLPVLTNKQRRIQSVADLKSYKNFLRTNGQANYVWGNPFLVGFIELHDICSPNLTRDDLKDSSARERIYEKLLELQQAIERKVDEHMNKKAQDSYKKLGRVMSDCLSRILKSFKLQFQLPSGPGSADGRRLAEESGDAPFGGDEPGGGGPGGDNESHGGKPGSGHSGPGDDKSGGGDGAQRKGTQDQNGGGTSVPSAGPLIDFQNHAGEDRVIDLGNSLVINTLHTDFIQRNSGREGKIRLDSRLINYVAVVICPYLVHKLFEKRGKIPTALEAGTNIVNLMTQLEQELNKTMLGSEIQPTT